MTAPRQMSVTGGLYAAKAGRELRISSDDWGSIDAVAVEDADVVGWSTLSLRSKERLLNEPVEPAREYEYYYFFRRSGDRFLLVSSDARLVEELLRRSGVASQVVSPVVDVGRCVREFAEHPARYAMSAVYARVEGFGHSLRTVVLYGNDLADARLFLELLPKLSPYRVNLRDVSSRSEIVSISSRGEVAFTYAGPSSLRDVDKALHFLSDKKYLHWD